MRGNLPHKLATSTSDAQTDAAAPAAGAAATIRAGDVYQVHILRDSTDTRLGITRVNRRPRDISSLDAGSLASRTEMRVGDTIVDIIGPFGPVGLEEMPDELFGEVFTDVVRQTPNLVIALQARSPDEIAAEPFSVAPLPGSTNRGK